MAAKKSTPKKGTSQKAPAKPRRKKRSVNQFVLYSLLVVIAVLLGVLIALVPRGLPDDGLVGGTPAHSETTNGGAPDAGAGDGDTPDEPAVAAGGDAAVAEPEDDHATERYPEDEERVAHPEREEDEHLWWLPDAASDGTGAGTLYLVLDDAGNSAEPLPAFLEFPPPFAVAVLPQLAYSVEAAAWASAAGKEIMLHLPMEAQSGANLGPGGITVSMTDREILRVLEEDLGSVPGVIGVNNHMGSAATSDRRVMELVLADLTRRELFFVDSRTSADTVARDVAESLMLPFAERHVFLDNDRSHDAILAAIGGALELAHRQEHVVMIGHATVAELAQVLVEIYPVLLDHGYRFGRISDLVAGS